MWWTIGFATATAPPLDDFGCDRHASEDVAATDDDRDDATDDEKDDATDDDAECDDCDVENGGEKDVG